MGSMADTQYTAEIHFAQSLADNDKKIRDKTIKKLKRWLMAKSSPSSKGNLTEEDFIKLWKGLHYCMWMQDKPLIQEELADNIVSLIHIFTKPKTALTFVKAYFITEAREWNGIDRWRLDKFMMLFRKMLRNSCILLKNNKWSLDSIASLSSVLKETILAANNDRVPDGIRLHLADIYVDELTLIGHEEITGDMIVTLLEPFVHFIAYSNNIIIAQKILSTVFTEMIDRYIEHINTMKLENEQSDNPSDENDEELIGDIQSVTAKQTDVEEPSDEEISDDELENDVTENKILQFDFGLIAEKILKITGAQKCSYQNRKILYNLVKRLQNLAAGVVPTKQKIPTRIEKDEDISLPRSVLNKAVRRLAAFQVDLFDKSRKKKEHIAEEGLDDDSDAGEIENLNVAMMTGQPPKQKSKKKKSTSEVQTVGGSEKIQKQKAKKGKHKLNVTEDDDDDGAVSSKKKRKNRHRDDSESSLSENTGVDRKKDLLPFSGNEKKNAEKIAVFDENQNMLIESQTEHIKTSDSEKKLTQDKFTVLKKKRNRRGNKMNESTLSSCDGPDSNTVVENAEAVDSENTLAKLKKKKKGKKEGMSLSSNCSADISVANESCGSLSLNIETTNVKSKKKKHPKRRKKKEMIVKKKDSEFLEDGEVEISIPSKKSKDKSNQSENFDKWQKTFSNYSLSSPKDPVRKGSPFAQFESIKKTPPAFVKKAISKVAKKKSKKSETSFSTEINTPSSNKKNVSFDMMKNTSLDFQDSITFSPDLPFQPSKKPNQGILKTPVSQSPLKGLRKLSSKKKLSAKKRLKASDFF